MHAGNPANYDPLFALLLLGYFLLIDAWERTPPCELAGGAGLCLSMLELLRPFMIYLLPLFLLVEWHRIHLKAPRCGLALTAFLLPVVVLSGGWHLHLYLAHDHQITWTNISGYNLQRAWEDRSGNPRLSRINCRTTASFGRISTRVKSIGRAKS